MDANGRFQAPGSRLSDVLRIEIGGQIAGGHDLILEFVIEVSDVQNRAVVRYPLLNAGIVADAFLGLQRRIICKREFESVRSAEAGSKTGVRARWAEKAVTISLPRHIRGGSPRCDLGEGLGGNSRLACVVVARNGVGLQVVHAQAHVDEPAIGGSPAVFREERIAIAPQHKGRVAGAFYEGVLELISVVFESGYQRVLG